MTFQLSSSKYIHVLESDATRAALTSSLYPTFVLYITTRKNIFRHPGRAQIHRESECEGKHSRSAYACSSQSYSYIQPLFPKELNYRARKFVFSEYTRSIRSIPHRIRNPRPRRVPWYYQSLFPIFKLDPVARRKENVVPYHEVTVSSSEKERCNAVH